MKAGRLHVRPHLSLINKYMAISCCVSPVSESVWQINMDECMSRTADDNDRTWRADTAHCRCPDHMDGYCCSSPSPPQMVPAATQHNKTSAIVLPVAIIIRVRREKDRKNNYFLQPGKSVLLQSRRPEGKIPERMRPEWLLVIDWYGNESLIIPGTRACTLTAPWPALWQTVTSSCHTPQGLIKHDPEINT